MRNSGKIGPEFDQYAGSYATLLQDPIRNRFAKDPLHFHRRKWLLIQRIFQQLGIAAASLRWLDVGCGRGELLELAGPHFAQAVGCDPSASMLASGNSLQVRRQPSPVELPFADASVDFVTAVCVYHHVHGNARVLLTREIRRVLAPAGLFCLLEHNPWNPITRAIVRRCPVDADAELLSPRCARSLLLAGGLQPLRTDYFLYLPENLFNCAGWLEAPLRGIPFGGQYALLAKISNLD